MDMKLHLLYVSQNYFWFSVGSFSCQLRPLRSSTSRRLCHIFCSFFWCCCCRHRYPSFLEWLFMCSSLPFLSCTFMIAFLAFNVLRDNQVSCVLVYNCVVRMLELSALGASLFSLVQSSWFHLLHSMFLACTLSYFCRTGGTICWSSCQPWVGFECYVSRLCCEMWNPWKFQKKKCINHARQI